MDGGTAGMAGRRSRTPRAAETPRQQQNRSNCPGTADSGPGHRLSACAIQNFLRSARHFAQVRRVVRAGTHDGFPWGPLDGTDASSRI